MLCTVKYIHTCALGTGFKLVCHIIMTMILYDAIVFFIKNISYIKFSCWILILHFQQKHTRNFVHNHNLLTTTNANKLFHFHFFNCIKIYIQTFQEHPSPRSLQYTIGNPQTPTNFFNLLALIGQGSPWVCDAFSCCPSLKRAGNLRRKTIVR